MRYGAGASCAIARGKGGTDAGGRRRLHFMHSQNAANRLQTHLRWSDGRAAVNGPTHLPATITLGGEETTLRRVALDDKDRLLFFALQLPPQDLLFLRRDITNPEEVDDWLADAESGQLETTVALVDDKIVGYAALDHGGLHWERHRAAIRVLIDASVRSRGLGAALLQIAFDSALEHGVTKLVAQMTVEQPGAAALFERLGFEEEAILRNHVVDMDGKLHDVRVLSFFADDQHLQVCDSCEARVVTRLPLAGQQLCWSCYEMQYVDLGSGA